MNAFLAQARSHWFSQTSKSGAVGGHSEQAAGPARQPRGSQAAPGISQPGDLYDEPGATAGLSDRGLSIAVWCRSPRAWIRLVFNLA